MPTRMTITEALADIKTIGARIAKKREFVAARLSRPAQVIDPLQAEGGMAEVIKRERQSAADLRERLVNLRSAIAKSNQETLITVEGITRSVADWIVWRREIASDLQSELNAYASTLNQLRMRAQQQGVKVAKDAGEAQLQDLIFNIPEIELAAQRDQVEKALGTLDGVLSLKNATTFVEVED